MSSTPGDVVAVGFDGSDASCAAVDWAAVEAGRRGVSLLVVTAVDYPGPSTSYLAGEPAVPAMLFDEARELAAVGCAQAAKVLTEDRINSNVHEGSVAGHLVEVSQTAALLVVGNKRRSELGSVVAGSVSFALAAHAHSPVVLVPQADDHAPTRQGVVVGVDGSHASQQACHLAADAAVRSGAALSILSTWNIPVAGAWTNSAWADGGTDAAWGDALRDAAAGIADTAAAAVRASHPGLSVTIDLRQGPAAQALSQAGKDAALVVVGSRGRGGFASLVLGSVSHAVMHDCLSPVMIVR